MSRASRVLVVLYGVRAQVTTRYEGYSKIWQSTHEAFELVSQRLPDVSFDTMATWLKVSTMPVR